ncbi:hypothetical protein M3J09_008380 [Ascochyta lentis]
MAFGAAFCCGCGLEERWWWWWVFCGLLLALGRHCIHRMSCCVMSCHVMSCR